MFSSMQNAFSAGEISPSLWGRTDLVKWHQGAFTMRNFFVNYRGGASSRAGLAYVGTCKQPGLSAPPRDIPFQFNVTQGYALEFGDSYMRVKYHGAYVVESGFSITAATQSSPVIVTIPGHNYSAGDWIYITGMQGMTALNGLTWVVHSVPTPDTVTLYNLFGAAENTGAAGLYTSGGTAERIYTVTAPYHAVDLPYLKYTQSADTMTLTCVNTSTGTEYPPYELTRHSNANWVFSQITFASSIAAPTGVTATASNSTTITTWYSYVVTAVNGTTGEESVASTPATVENNDIAINAGSNTVSWNPVAGAGSYNIYKATPSYNVGVPVGSLYGYAGSAYGTQFTDSNITQDFTKTPPTHQNPFARGAIDAVTLTAGGSGYSQSTVGYTITTSTGSGFVGLPVVVGGAVVAVIIQNGGAGYQSGDTIAFTNGSGATATLTVGPQTGTYPGVVAYYQQRRVYAATLNNPDTYFFSQIGAYNNMDSSIPTSDTDAIVGAPWAQQVNGVQFMVPMPGGLVILTGKGAWQLNGGNSAALTPADQDANPQAYNGCNNIVPPITVNYDILYLQEKGSIFRDLSYNFFVNIYTGTDLTVISDHLFSGYTFNQWCWAEEPYKIAWAVRNDGILLSLTYLKEQDVYAWSRHDTDGLFVGVCSVTEPPVDAVYTIVRRYINYQWMYYSERFDNRIWSSPENCFCVDAGLSYPLNYPNANLVVAVNDTNIGQVTGVNLVTGGSGYTAPTVILALPNPSTGTPASFSVTVVGGVITAINVTANGSGYVAGTPLVIQDTTGSGAVAYAEVNTTGQFYSDNGGFSAGNVGDVIRCGGGMATIVAYIGAGVVLANITNPILQQVPDSQQNPFFELFVPFPAGSWSISTPVTVISGLNHLEGQPVSVVADGNVVPGLQVANGQVTLPVPASAITVGLPFICQLQTPYLDPPGQPDATQGKRKTINAATIRVEGSRGFSVGTDQVDASAAGGLNNAPWVNMIEVKERNAAITAGNALPFATGDFFQHVKGSWRISGQVAVQQTYPMPCNVLAIVSLYEMGDTSG